MGNNFGWAVKPFCQTDSFVISPAIACMTMVGFFFSLCFTYFIDACLFFSFLLHIFSMLGLMLCCKGFAQGSESAHFSAFQDMLAIYSNWGAPKKTTPSSDILRLFIKSSGRGWIGPFIIHKPPIDFQYVSKDNHIFMFNTHTEQWPWFGYCSHVNGVQGFQTNSRQWP